MYLGAFEWQSGRMTRKSDQYLHCGQVYIIYIYICIDIHIFKFKCIHVAMVVGDAIDDPGFLDTHILLDRPDPLLSINFVNHSERWPLTDLTPKSVRVDQE